MNHDITTASSIDGSASRRRAAAAVIALLSSAAMLVGCENMSARERGTAQGAGLGAVAGALLGGATGNSAGQGAVLGGAVGAVVGNLWSKRLEDKRRALAQTTSGTNISVDRTPDNRLRVNVPSDASFATGRADIQPELRPVLDELSRDLDVGTRIEVVGHTDSTGGESLNDALSLQRAESVRQYLSRRGVDPQRVWVNGRGEREPVASNATDGGRAMNRRVEIYLSEPQS